MLALEPIPCPRTLLTIPPVAQEEVQPEYAEGQDELLPTVSLLQHQPQSDRLQDLERDPDGREHPIWWRPGRLFDCLIPAGIIGWHLHTQTQSISRCCRPNASLAGCWTKLHSCSCCRMFASPASAPQKPRLLTPAELDPPCIRKLRKQQQIRSTRNSSPCLIALSAASFMLHPTRVAGREAQGCLVSPAAVKWAWSLLLLWLRVWLSMCAFACCASLYIGY